MRGTDGWSLGRPSAALVRPVVVLLFGTALSACGQRLPPPAPVPAYGEPVTVEAPPDDDRGRVTERRREQRRASPQPEGRPVETDPILASPWVGDPEVEERVQWWIGFWQERARGSFERYLMRMGRYEQYVAGEVAERNLPPSLRYLPIIEAGYNPSAISPAGAGGLWQFMPPTARWLGLEVSSVVDQRLDPYAATPLALDYLASLNERFGSWWLALAAYNVGPTRVARLISRHAPDAERDDALYWRLRPNLPAETREFVPKYLAAVRIARSPSAYGFGDVDIEDPWVFDIVEVDGAASLDVVSEAAGASEDEVRHLNQHLTRGLTPAGVSTPVRVPLGFGQGFQERLARIPANERVTVTEHHVASGETFGHIAQQYRVSVSEIRAANPHIEPRRLQIGTRLVIPGTNASGGGGSTSVAATTPEPSRAASAAPLRSTGRVHVVSSGESLWTIARRYDVRVAQLVGWNDMSRNDAIFPGDELRIQEPGAVTYTVQPGDTIWEIAEDRGLRPDDLLQYNGLSPNALIRPGDEIQIPPQNSGT